MAKNNQQQQQQQPKSSNLWKLSLLIAIISFGIYFIIQQQQHHHHEWPRFNEKIKNFVYDTWHTFSLTNSLIYKKLFSKQSNNDDQRNEKILKQLLEIENNVIIKRSSRIAVGLGVCTDLVINAIDLLNEFPSPNNSLPHDHIDNWTKFLELFAYYFQRGAASERYIESKEVFNKLIKLIDEKKIKKKETIGSNAPLISLRFANENFENILLGAQITKNLMKKFPKNIQISGPIIEQDDYHLILEYNYNQQWYQYTSPRANRLIIHSDDNNVKLLSRIKFFEQLKQFAPDLLIITGLHMLDNSPIDFATRTNVIDNLANNLQNVNENEKTFPSSLRTHFEMASFTENQLLNLVIEKIFPYMDSFGMNEQEATNLLSLMKFGNITYSTNPFPRVAHVLDEMRELFQLIYSINNSKRISRIHVHTLAYQVIMTRIDHQQSIWKSNKEAMAKASLTAYRHTCDTNEIDLKRVNILLDDSFSTTKSATATTTNETRIELDDAVKCWQENLNQQMMIKVEICLAIGMVCTNVVQTVGAGDNISASGLMIQI